LLKATQFFLINYSGGQQKRPDINIIGFAV
jgi:hypothetical protein